MDKRKAKALEADGWKIGSVQELLELTDEEALLIEMRVVLARALKARRQRKKLSQTKLAALMGSSQPRVAAMEKGDANIELLLKGLLVSGATPKEIGKEIGSAAA